MPSLTPSGPSGGTALPAGQVAASGPPLTGAAVQPPAPPAGAVSPQPGGALAAQVTSAPVQSGSQQARLPQTPAYQPPGGVNTVAVSAQPGSVLPGPAAELAGAAQKALGEQQAGLTGLFAQIGSLAGAQAAGQVSLPDPVVRTMQQILGLRLNLSGGPSAGDLQNAVRQSGQFREAQLALPGSTSAGVADLKSVLLSFRSLLQQFGARPEISKPAAQPPPPSRNGAPQGQAPQSANGFWAGAAPENLKTLLKDTDAALARLRLTQLANTGLARDSGPQMAAKPMDMVLELPLSLGQETAVMQMQVGRDGAGHQGDDEAEPGWRLRFALDLTATGPLEAAISLRGGGTYASLWVDRKDTFDNLNALRDTMEAAFADAGLDLQELRLIRGLPPRTAALYGAMIDRQS